MDLYLYMTEDYQEIENDKFFSQNATSNSLLVKKEEVFFQVKNFYFKNLTKDNSKVLLMLEYIAA